MSRPVRITPLAEADIASAQDEYESRDPGLGNRFVQQVRSTLTRIGQNPFQYQLVPGTHDDRRAPVRNFPWAFGTGFEPDESAVIACLAYRRDVKLVRSRASKPDPSP